MALATVCIHDTLRIGECTYHVQEGLRQSSDQQSASGDSYRLLCKVANMLACSPTSEIVHNVQNMQNRLLRFDGLLPKYQRVLSHVYEVLRVSSLEEVIPAMEKLVQGVE
jgi:hypothetical protein